MDPVESDISSDDHNLISRLSLLFCGGFPLNFFWNEANGSDENERFSAETIFEIHEPLRSRNSRFISSGIHSSNHSLHDLPWFQHGIRFIPPSIKQAFIFRIAKAKSVAIHNRF